MRARNRVGRFPFFILAVLLTLGGPAAAVAGGGNSPSYGHPGQASQVDRTIQITAVDLAFKPDSVTVRRGETVKFVVTDRGKLTHSFVIGPKALQEKHDKSMRAMTPAQRAREMAQSKVGFLMKPGQTKSLIWTFDTKLQRMQYACHIPGHYKAGMFGVIHVQGG